MRNAAPRKTIPVGIAVGQESKQERDLSMLLRPCPSVTRALLQLPVGSSCSQNVAVPHPAVLQQQCCSGQGARGNMKSQLQMTGKHSFSVEAEGFPFLHSISSSVFCLPGLLPGSCRLD
uniref:Uncharacterized protein n=1 Tax=Phasianus colchicus TaxID=9054 RepID=A0A669QCL2_PHACC